MHISKLVFRALSILVIIFMCVACNPQGSTTLPASPSKNTPLSDTPMPPIATPVLSSPTVTATPRPGPLDYLLTLQDVPEAVKQLDLITEVITGDVQDWDYESRILFVSSGADDARLQQSIVIQKKPLEKLIPNSCQCDALEAPQIGQSALAYQEKADPQKIILEFFKGRVHVTITGTGIDAQTIFNLGKLVESRIPEQLPEIPSITFPEQLDQGTFAKYFKLVNIGDMNPDNTYDAVVPLTIFKPGWLCWGFDAYEAIKEVNSYAYAIYDPQAKVYVNKISYALGIANSATARVGGCSSITSVPGHYEFKLAVNHVLVASIPFDMMR